MGHSDQVLPGAGYYGDPGVLSYTREDVKEENVGKFGIDATAPISKRYIYKRRTNCMEDKVEISDYYKP